MGGFHLLDLIIVAGIALALLGPKALQSIARDAGKGMGQARQMKDKLMSELPIEEFTKVKESIPQIPMNPRQAVEKLIMPDEKKNKETKTTRETAEQKTSEQAGESKPGEAR